MRSAGFRLPSILTLFVIAEIVVAFFGVVRFGFFSFLGYLFLMILLGALLFQYALKSSGAMLQKGALKEDLAKQSVRTLAWVLAAVLFAIPGVISDLMAVLLMVSPVMGLRFLSSLGLGMMIQNAERQARGVSGSAVHSAESQGFKVHHIDGRVVIDVPKESQESDKDSK